MLQAEFGWPDTKHIAEECSLMAAYIFQKVHFNELKISPEHYFA